MFPDEELSLDGFLDGRVSVLQPRSGFRSSVDAVLMAAAVQASEGESVLELGCGAGAALLCLGRRVPGLRLTGLELQADYAELARRNAVAAGQAAEIFCGDLRSMPTQLRSASFDHVFANPPYHERGKGTAARNSGREAALREGETALLAWVSAGMKRLRPRGTLTMIQAVERLPEALAAVGRSGAGVTVLPIQSRSDRPAGRVLLRAIKEGRAAFRLCAPLILHDGPRHERDGDDYSARARAVLRDMAALDF